MLSYCMAWAIEVCKVCAPHKRVLGGKVSRPQQATQHTAKPLAVS